MLALLGSPFRLAMYGICVEVAVLEMGIIVWFMVGMYEAVAVFVLGCAIELGMEGLCEVISCVRGVFIAPSMLNEE